MLYMNEPKEKNEQEQADLFAFDDQPENTPVEAVAEVSADDTPAPAPETLPLIPEKNPAQVQQKPVEKKPPLIFSAHSPVPTRGGVQEDISEKRKRLSRLAAKEIVPLTMDRVPSDDLTLGAFLRLARENAGYELQEVADFTRISLNYLNAFEANRLKDLPPMIYQTAYLRELFTFYRLPEETVAFARQLHQQQFSTAKKNDDLLLRANPANHVPDEERQASRFLYGSVIAIGVLILLVIWAIVAALVKYNGEAEMQQSQTMEVQEAVRPTAPPVKFDQKKFENLTPERMLNLNTLEMSNTPAIRR